MNRSVYQLEISHDDGTDDLGLYGTLKRAREALKDNADYHAADSIRMEERLDGNPASPHLEIWAIGEDESDASFARYYIARRPVQ
jgi:hypothetical protein